MQLKILDNGTDMHNHQAQMPSLPNSPRTPDSLLYNSLTSFHMKSNYFRYRKTSPVVPSRFCYKSNSGSLGNAGIAPIVQSGLELYYLTKVYVIMSNGRKEKKCDTAINAIDGNAFHAIYIKQKLTKPRAAELLDIPMANDRNALCRNIKEIMSFIAMLYPFKNNEKGWKVALLNEYMNPITNVIQLHDSLKRESDRIIYAKVTPNLNKEKDRKVPPKCSLHYKSRTFFKPLPFPSSLINPSRNNHTDRNNDKGINSNPHLFKNQELQIKVTSSSEMNNNQLNTDTTLLGRMNTFQNDNDNDRHHHVFKTSLHYTKPIITDESKQYPSDIDSDNNLASYDLSNIQIQTHPNTNTNTHTNVHSRKNFLSYASLRHRPPSSSNPNDYPINNSKYFKYVNTEEYLRKKEIDYLFNSKTHYLLKEKRSVNTEGNNDLNQIQRFKTTNLLNSKPRRIRDVKSAKCPSYFDDYVYSTKTNHKVISKGKFRYVKKYLHDKYKETAYRNEMKQFEPLMIMHSIKEEISNPKVLYVNAIGEFRLFFETTFERMIKQENLDMIDCLTCNYIFFNDLEYFPINKVRKEFLFWAILSMHVEKNHKEMINAFLANELDMEMRTSWKRSTYKRNTRHRETNISNNNLPIEDAPSQPHAQAQAQAQDQAQDQAQGKSSYKKSTSFSRSRRLGLLSNTNFTKMIQELYFIMKKMTQDIRPFLNTFQFEEKNFGISFFLFIFFLSSDDYFALDEEISYRIFTELNIDSTTMTFQHFVEYYIHIKYGVNLKVEKKFVFAKKVIPRIWTTDYRSDDSFSQKLKDCFGIRDFVVKLLPNMNESQIKKNRVMIEDVYFNMVKYFYPEGYIDYNLP